MATNAVDEEELKLELTPDGADALEGAGLFASTPTAVRQESVYFDTPGHDLSQAGLALRIRRSGKRRVQTVKADRSAAGMLVRSEWEQEVSGDRPVIDGDTPVAALLGDRAALLAPVFTVENARRVWMQDGVEVALDRGRIIAGDRSTPICEVELERKGGDLAGLYDLARRIDAVTPVRINVLSKGERGYRLLGPVPRAVKAPRVELGAEMTAGQAFQAIAGACIDQFHRNLPVILDHDDAAALHQARVAIRRLRSALSIYKSMLAQDRTGARIGRELRWLATKLAPAREVDVLIGEAKDAALLDRLIAARSRAYAGAGITLRSKRCRALMIDLAEWIAVGDWTARPGNAEARDQPVGEFAAEALRHRRKVLKKRGHNLAELDDEARHKARKAAKKMRYAADFFATLYTRKQARHRRERFVDALESLQDRLGALNDLATAPAVVERLDLSDLPEAAALIDGGGKRRLVKSAARALDDFEGAKCYW
ncbi:CHAD domain-containing protein [Novosphingobium sp. BL-8H]|uniref:CYTH and CHAD domain-containing protein n=1 Tax=Novosphingobium sp. BL-8H TaxID=3127640 RepID=UPI003757E117